MARLRTAKWIACLLASWMMIPYLGSAALAASPPDPASVQSVVVFPIDQPAGMSKAELVDQLNLVVMKGIDASGRYDSIRYTERLPVVQRLVATQSGQDIVTTGPFAADSVAKENAGFLAASMKADLFLVGSIEKYTVAESRDAVEIEVSAELFDVRTRHVVSNAAVSGKADAASVKGTASVDELATQAAMDAGRKIVAAVTGEMPAEQTGPAEPVPVVVTSSKRSSKKSWIPLLLLSLGVGLLLGGGGGDDDGGSSGDDGTPEPPPPPPF